MGPLRKIIPECITELLYSVNVSHIQFPRFTGRARRTTRRAVSRPDMTPLVGLGFLLVSFFLMAADFVRPIIMQLTMPVKPTADDMSVRGCCGNAITVILEKDHKLFYYEGLNTLDSTPTLYKTSFAADGLRKTLLEFKRHTSCGLVLIKPSDKASYQDMVDVLDETHTTGITKYALTDLYPEDQKLLNQQHAH